MAPIQIKKPNWVGFSSPILRSIILTTVEKCGLWARLKDNPMYSIKKSNEPDKNRKRLDAHFLITHIESIYGLIYSGVFIRMNIYLASICFICLFWPAYIFYVEYNLEFAHRLYGSITNSYIPSYISNPTAPRVWLLFSIPICSTWGTDCPCFATKLSRT